MKETFKGYLQNKTDERERIRKEEEKEERLVEERRHKEWLDGAEQRQKKEDEEKKRLAAERAPLLKFLKLSNLKEDMEEISEMLGGGKVKTEDLANDKVEISFIFGRKRGQREFEGSQYDAGAGSSSRYTYYAEAVLEDKMCVWLGLSYGSKNSVEMYSFFHLYRPQKRDRFWETLKYSDLGAHYGEKIYDIDVSKTPREEIEKMSRDLLGETVETIMERKGKD